MDWTIRVGPLDGIREDAGPNVAACNWWYLRKQGFHPSLREMILQTAKIIDSEKMLRE